MKKLFNKFKSNPMLLVFIIILVFFMPSALFSPGESNQKAIVTAIGLDKENGEYEISLLTFIPTPNQTYVETNSVISGKGKTVANAISNAELTLGKEIGLSHAKTTIVSESVLQDDVAMDIDYLSRVSSLSENTVFICTNESAKEFLLAAQSLEKEIGLKLEELISYNVNNIYVADTTLEAFYKGYFSPNKASLLGYLSLEETGEGGSETGSSGGSSGGGGSGGGAGGVASPSESGGGAGCSGGGNQNAKKISNEGDVVLLKSGIMVAKLSEEQLNGINILNPKAVSQIITIDNINTGKYHNASLTFIVRNKRIMTATKFENGIPIYVANIVMGMELIEAKEESGVVINNYELSEIPKPVEFEIEQKIKREFADTLSLLRSKRTDVIGIREKFEKENRKNFHKFLAELDDPDDFLRFINFELIIKVQSD